MPYPLGVSFKYQFYPILNDKPVSLPTQTLTMYLYDEQPTREQGLAGTGALATETCTLSAANTVAEFDVDAIADPDPNSEIDCYTYWVAIKYVLVASGQAQLVIRALELERVKGHHVALTVSQSDLIAVWKAVGSYVSASDVITKVATATDELKAELRNDGYEWASIWRPDRLKSALVYKVLSGIAFGEIQESGDAFQEIAVEYRKTYTNLRDSLKLEIGEKEPEPDPRPISSGAMLYSK